MKTSTFELYCAICHFLAWITYFLLAPNPPLLNAFLVMAIMAGFTWVRSQHAVMREYLPRQLRVVLGALMCLPMLLTIICLFVYSSLNDAQWVFIFSSCALGISVASYFRAKFNY